MTTTVETYGHPLAVHEEAERIIRGHLYGLCNQVGDAISFSDAGLIPTHSSLYISVDDLENLYPDPTGWDDETCKEWLRENVGDEWEDEYDRDTLADAVRDNATPAEVYQWFHVSQTLHSWLRDAGEVVAEWGTMCVWGRQCAGQDVILDGTFQRLARENLRARGEKID